MVSCTLTSMAMRLVVSVHTHPRLLRPRQHQLLLLGRPVTAVGLRLVAVGMMVLLASRSAAARNVTAVGPHPAAVGMMVRHAFINAAAMRWPTAQKSQYER